MDSEQTSLSAEQMLGIIRRRALWILLCLILVAGAAYGYAKHKPKKYTAAAEPGLQQQPARSADRRACDQQQRHPPGPAAGQP